MSRRVKSAKKPSEKFQVPGFLFSGTACGIKASGQKDLALIYSEIPARAVACFTTNRVQAAPVLQGKAALKDGRLQAVVVNSGNANAVTGPQGLTAAKQTAAAAAQILGCRAQDVLVSSTGKIGVPLPVKKILKGLSPAVFSLSSTHWSQVAAAIMTTDRFPKVSMAKGKIRGKNFHILGVAKGAGMIEPNMATMLAYILTDLDLSVPLMRSVFKDVVGQTFNAISVDGDMSTNDTALLWANGASGCRLSSRRSPGFSAFEKLLYGVCRDLALMMVRDGEGATKVVGIEVEGAKSDAAARRMAFAVARSSLVKTSFFGEDPNWGRVLAALGYSGETFDPSRVDISYGGVALLRRGRPVGGTSQAKAHRVMKAPEFSVKIHLHGGKGQARVFASDLTYEYVKINAEYST